MPAPFTTTTTPPPPPLTLTALQSHVESTMTTLIGKLQLLTTERDHLTSTVSALTSQVSDLQSSLTLRSSAASSLLPRVASLTSANADLEGENARLAKENARLAGSLKESQGLVARLDEEAASYAMTSRVEEDGGGDEGEEIRRLQSELDTACSEKYALELRLANSVSGRLRPAGTDAGGGREDDEDLSNLLAEVDYPSSVSDPVKSRDDIISALQVDANRKEKEVGRLKVALKVEREQHEDTMRRLEELEGRERELVERGGIEGLRAR